MLATGGEHAPVVVERGVRELAVLGLDARPLDREPVRAEAEIGEQRDVLRVAPEVVAASPDGSAHPDPGVCSHAHQSLFQLPPSIWCAAVAVPQRKPSGNVIAMGGHPKPP